MASETQDIPAYEGTDMASYVMASGFDLGPTAGPIKSITNVRDTAIIVCEWAIYRVKPGQRTGFYIELATRL